MPEYIDKPCIVCGKPFQAGDDIVTCPECGTPYHRACWQQNGKCVNTALHEQGGSWFAQQAEEDRQRRAENAEQEAPEHAAEPDFGREPFPEQLRFDPADPCLGMNPDEQLDGVALWEAAAFIRTNRFYYLPLFRLMKRTGKKTSINPLGLLVPQFFFANRKMWVHSLLAILLNTLTGLPAVIRGLYEVMGIQIPWADATTPLFASIYKLSIGAYLGISVFWGMFANYFYYRFMKRKVTELRTSRNVGSKTELEYLLRTSGGTNTLNILLTMIIQFSVSVTVYTVLMFVR